MKQIITEEDSGVLLKEYVQRLGISKRMLTDIKFGGGDLLVNGGHVTVRYVLQKGDELVIQFPPEKMSESLQPEEVPLHILFEDDHVLVLNKQPCISSIPSREHPSGSLANGLIHYYQRTGVHATVHLVSRLDRDTSGVMLVAKHRFAHSLLSGPQKGSRQTAISSGRPRFDRGRAGNDRCADREKIIEHHRAGGNPGRAKSSDAFLGEQAFQRHDGCLYPSGNRANPSDPRPYESYRISLVR